MKSLMLPFVLLAFSLWGTCSWADRVQWDHFGAKEDGDVKLGDKAFDANTHLSLVELYGRKGQFTNGVSYLFYRLVATIDGKKAVIWSRPVVYARDWLRGWFCTFDGEKNRLGLVVLGQRTTCFFDIPLLATNDCSNLVRQLPVTTDSETSLAFEEQDRLRCIQKLGPQFRHIGSPVDALLEAESGNWILHLKFRQPRRADDGSETFAPGVEDEAIEAVFSRSVSDSQKEWKLSSVNRESLHAAQCRHTLSEIDANKKAWYKKHGRSQEAVLDAESFLKESYEGKLPQCPEGGKYALGTLDEPATCSIHGTHGSRLSFTTPSERKLSGKHAE